RVLADDSRPHLRGVRCCFGGATPTCTIAGAMPRSLLLIVLATTACAGAPTPPSTPEAPPSTQVVVQKNEAPADAPAGKPTHGKLYALVVSFTSPGNGTDGAAFERLRGVIADVGAARVGHVHGTWGKEGEHDECFDLAA